MPLKVCVNLSVCHILSDYCYIYELLYPLDLLNLDVSDAYCCEDMSELGDRREKSLKELFSV